MGVLSEIGEGRDPATDPVTPVIGHDQVQSLLVIKGRNFIVIAHHLTISVKE
jgi:hypothetical protein